MAEFAFVKGVTTHDLRRADGSMWFWLVHGWLDETPSVRGEDRPVALRHGLHANPRWKTLRKPEIRGALKAATWPAMLALQQELLTIFDPTERGDLVVADEYKGLAAGQTATLSQVLPLAVVGADTQNEFHRIYTVTLESTDVPPEWVIAGP